MNIKVVPYIPNPLRCFKCQRYGHGSSRCSREQKCSKCAGDHSVDTCTSETSCCVNCTDGNDHASSDRKCPVYVKEQLVQKIRYTENISFPEARKRVESATPSSSSYSTIVKSTPKVQVTSTAVQTLVTCPNDQEKPSTITEENTEIPNQIATQTTSSSVSHLNGKTTEIRQNRQQVHKARGVSGRGTIPPKDSPITTANRFFGLERMETEEVPVSSTKERPRSRSPIKPP